ncbi:MAG: Gfo/Idh/MocA family oxidoreductase [Bacteroidota bacterium]|nr:Gfo/Idh/MocA family oxidoreductase [Bacteroidota bacterium]MDP4206825.1 Gfo/Idh/MocA family oxidoreductase [Bacteroidota bacterium]
MKEKTNSRRTFIQKLVTASAAMAVAPTVLNASVPGRQTLLVRDPQNKKSMLNSNLQIALIGAGGMGRSDANTALRHAGVKLVAVADLYEKRLQDAKAAYGEDVFITRDYRELLNRKDIDAVIVATPDHWHQQISVEAMEAGKHVYCEKPMVHSIEEGPSVLETQRKTKKVFEVGSQLLSSLGYEKAKELLNQGAIGKLNYAEGVWSRRTSDGAWNYAIPDDASEKNISWDTFLKGGKKLPFNPERFFRWRKYLDYGSGMNGDLFVHIISGLHFVTNSYGPSKIYSSGGIRFWNDGREVPDVMLGTFDYNQCEAHSGFNLSLRCNFVDGTNGAYYYVMRLVGSEGLMEVYSDKVTLYRNKVLEGVDPNTVRDLSSNADVRKRILGPEEIVYKVEEGYKGEHYDHFGHWFDAIRNGGEVLEDAAFGYRAAAPAILCMESYLQKKVVQWDPIKMKKL